MEFMSELSRVLDVVGSVVNRQGAQLLNYALILAAVGTLAMAVVEILKSVFMGRMWFNRWRVSRWTRDRTGMTAPGKKDGTTRGQNPVLSELELLSVGAHSNPHALYDQPIEKMMGQIQAAVNLALEYPKEYPNLYSWITKVPERYWKKGASIKTRGDSAHWLKNIANVHKIRALPATAQLRGTELASAQEASKARARLNNLVARKLDAFQNQSQYSWERWNQFSATAIGMIVFLMALYDSSQDNLVQYIALALPAGVIAPFAKQVAGALSSFGK